MFDHAFVATSVALGATLDDALAALDDDEAPETLRMTPVPSLRDLVAGLRAPTRPERARALALAVHEVLVAVDEGKLR
jgi:hypothetical protein